MKKNAEHQINETFQNESKNYIIYNLQSSVNLVKTKFAYVQSL